MVIKCVEDEKISEKVRKYLKVNNINSIYVYGDEQLSAFIYNLLRDVINVKGFIARDICRKEICGMPVINICDYKPVAEDNIIVINYKYIDIIRKDLEMTGFKGKLIEMDKFIDSVLKLDN